LAERKSQFKGCRTEIYTPLDSSLGGLSCFNPEVLYIRALDRLIGEEVNDMNTNQK
jgi:hypothetical protein